MIEHIDIINLSHYDIGFTDHPSVVRAMQRRYLDMAIDLTADNAARPAGARYFWTVESNDALVDWWQSAAPGRRASFLDRVQCGWIEVCAMPFNHTPALDARQWQALARWLPDELWDACRPRVIMQNDVNGFPRAGAMALMQRGAEFLWMGINRDTGGSPRPQPSAFWWQMPDGRRILVWNSIHYGDGYFLFEPSEWRRGPLPGAGDPRYRPPRDGDIFDPTPANLRRAQDICRTKLAAWEAQGYSQRRVVVSVTNMWREDNDPPLPQLAPWVAAWNAAGLHPTLALTTPGPALAALRAEAREALPALAGEWANWWANGVAAMPRELAASREAKRLVAALSSPVFPPHPSRDALADDCLRHLCLFDEHTGGSWNSESMPDSWDSRGQAAEKQVLAYRPLALAELALGDALRSCVPGAPTGAPCIHVANPYPEPFTGWVTLTDDCLRGDYAGVRDGATGAAQPFDRLPGPSPFYTVPTEPGQFSPLDTGKVFPDSIPGKSLRFWVEALPPHSVRSFHLLGPAEPVCQFAPPPAGPQVSTDELGWPICAQWGDVSLFAAGIGDFYALEFGGLAPRWTYKEVLRQPDEASRRAARDRLSTLTNALPVGGTRVRDTGPTLLYEQYLSHPRLRVMRRTLELCKAAPRARLHVTLNRLARPESAEVLYLRIPLHAPGWSVACTNGGLPFAPGLDQLPHTCADYYAVDGRVLYAPPPGEGPAPRVRVLECHDNALLSFGGMFNGLMRERFEGDPSQVYAILYDNIWYTNFVGDESGVMDFRFDLYEAPAETTPDNDGLPSLAGARSLGHAPRAWAVVRV